MPAFLSQWGRGTSLDTWESRELLPMAELVYGGRFDLKPARNTRETLLLPIAGLEPFKQPGVYLAVMRQAGTYNYSQPATMFTLSDIGLSAHRYRERLDVFTQALEGGKALEAVQLQLLDSEGRVLGEGRTDSDGHAELALPAKAEVLLAQQGAQTSLLRLSGAALDLAEFDIAGPQAHPLQFFVFGPRDLYRPGETVLLNALLRDADGRAVQNQPVNVEVRRPDEQVSRKFVWQAGDNGLYQYALPIAGEAPTGRWQLVFDLGDGQPQLYEFLVEDFLPERLALELKGREVPFSPAENAQFEVTGRYLYGAPAAGNRLSGQLYVRPLREAVASLPGYQFGSVNEEELSQDLELDETVLDADGQASLEIESKWAEVKSPLKLILQASLQESGGRPITRRIVQPVWPAEQLPGLRPLFDGEEIDSNGLARVRAAAGRSAGQQAGQRRAEGAPDSRAPRLLLELLRGRWLELSLQREVPEPQRRDGQCGQGRHRQGQLPGRVGALTASRSKTRRPACSAACVSGPATAGRTTPKAAPCVPIRSSWRWTNPAYGNGDTATVTVTPPAAGSGYLLVESAEGPLWWQAIDVPAEGKSFEIPIAKEWARHDLYVSALVIRPGERKANVTPKRAVGLLHLPLERAPRKLALSLSAAEKMRPNQPLTVKVKALNADGSVPKSVQVLVAAVDVGILNITEYATPDPFAAFFGRKGYGADQLDVYGQLIEAGQGRVAKLAFGGDAGLEAGGKRPDTSVLIVAQQSAPVSLNEQGEGEISLAIPDFNGELRLMAQAWSDDSYGMAEGKTVVAAPLIAELSAPRFLAGGDETKLALDISNLSGKEQRLDVQLSAAGQLRPGANGWPAGGAPAVGARPAHHPADPGAGAGRLWPGHAEGHR